MMKAGCQVGVAEILIRMIFYLFWYFIGFCQVHPKPCLASCEETNDFTYPTLPKSKERSINQVFTIQSQIRGELRFFSIRYQQGLGFHLHTNQLFIMFELCFIQLCSQSSHNSRALLTCQASTKWRRWCESNSPIITIK